MQSENKLPVNIKKMIKYLMDMETTIHLQKEQMAHTEKQFLQFKKCATSFIDFSKKQLEKKPRKPSGFRLPVTLSNELCDFLNIVHGSQLPRTEVTKLLIKYISDNQLINPIKKVQIIPDEKLLNLLGNDIDFTTLTRFTIQKYMNRHFLQNKESTKLIID
jgi:chromatin remodeling complex protein RSC6